ncbi:SH3 and PX domain-containing protein 2A-like [Actinia tenebrosa]|uniref:SH3 and PX domain-containing protein 2A-like n=1 Tax=Actinia tenebrosa TaxID=6105 RepID=A0A6P8IX96_ACTTE|nr:SH3 and PX domain-containing protein 2A-like [Actinia tenebrosa]
MKLAKNAVSIRSLPGHEIKMELRLPIDEKESATTLLYVVTANFVAIKERTKDKKKQYVFVFNVDWSDGTSSVVWRSYSEFFDLQCRLLDSFPEEAGSKRRARIIPYLPGRQIFKKSDSHLAEERRPHLIKYTNEILMLPKNISQGPIVVSFFHKRKGDPVCFNQFPSKLNTKLEFQLWTSPTKEEIQQPETNEVNDSENQDGHDAFGQVNLSYERSLSVGNRNYIKKDS